MGNILSGAQARLIFFGGAWRAADAFHSNSWHTSAAVVPLSKVGRHAF